MPQQQHQTSITTALAAAVDRHNWRYSGDADAATDKAKAKTGLAALLLRLGKGEPKPEQEPANVVPLPAKAWLEQIRRVVIPALRPGEWATLDCRIPGVATLLSQEPHIEVRVINDDIQIRRFDVEDELL